MSRRRILPFLIAPVLALAWSVPSNAAAYPKIVPLPDDFQPEGVATAANWVYSGSLWDGDVYRANLRNGTGSLLVDTDGRQALGLKADRRHGLLWVAGGFTGHAFVYDLATGADVADLDLGGGLVNDVIVTRRAAYFTETFAPVLYKVPIAADGSIGTPETITVTGDAGAATAPNNFGINGIDATANGKTLIINRTDAGALYTVNPRTGESRQITITGGTLTPGTPDGLLRVGHNVWVVENSVNRLTKVHVTDHWTTGTVTATLTDDAFEFPTTVARHGKRLEVVNGKFDLGFPPPIGPGAPPGTPFEVVQLKP